MNILSDELQPKNTCMGLTTKIKSYMFVYLHQRIIDLEVGLGANFRVQDTMFCWERVYAIGILDS